MVSQSMVNVALKEHMLRAGRGDRVGWMFAEVERASKAKTGSSTRRHSLLRAAGAVAAVVGALLAVPGR